MKEIRKIKYEQNENINRERNHRGTKQKFWIQKNTITELKILLRVSTVDLKKQTKKKKSLNIRQIKWSSQGAKRKRSRDKCTELKGLVSHQHLNQYIHYGIPRWRREILIRNVSKLPKLVERHESIKSQNPNKLQVKYILRKRPTSRHIIICQKPKTEFWRQQERRNSSSTKKLQ